MVPEESGLQRNSNDASPHQDGEYWEPSGIVTTMWVSLGIALGVLAFFLFGLLYTLIGRMPEDESRILNWPVIAGLTVAVLVAHQLLHVAVARSLGGTPRVEVDIVQMILPVMYCRIEGQFYSRTGFLGYLLAPLALPSLAGIVLMPLDERMVWIIIPLAANAALSVRDVWISGVVWKRPTESIVKVERDGVRIFRPV